MAKLEAVVDRIGRGPAELLDVGQGTEAISADFEDSLRLKVHWPLSML